MKLIIEIPEEVYKCVQDGSYCGSLFEELQASIPYNPSGDCISREALKDIAYINKGNFNTIEGIREWIDNAQAMPLPNEQTAWEQGYEAGLAQGKQDRPKGEYIRVDTLWAKCSICGNLTRVIKKYNMPNFCPACGADMRGEDNEKSN